MKYEIIMKIYVAYLYAAFRHHNSYLFVRHTALYSGTGF